ncbi:MAG: Phosphoglycerate kinase [Candidatus Levybacteria bacterium GW2011_GWA2_40_8]|nr:MAG: Phosphoglycerate kinase [Candidatus Levybacteria bacterium GW2011_GWA2_40_8]
MIKFKGLEEANIGGKTVLLRADLDVPIQDSKISDHSRLEACVSTLEYLLNQNCKIIICGHLGRPDPELRIKNNELSLEPIANWFAERFPGESLQETKLSGFPGWQIKENFFLLENLRFFEGEEKNDEEFAEKLAALSEVYVNDAFASSHRDHASIVGIPKFLPHFAGLHLQKEVETLSKAMENPRRPLTVVIGGAKIETKLPLVEKMHGFADYVLVGGEIAEHTRELLKVAHEKTGRKSDLFIADLTPDQKDITEESLDKFVQTANKSSTVVWNGPLGEIVPGVFENSTSKFAKSLSDNTNNIYSIVGGGDTVEFITRVGLKDKFSFVSVGGGAMLEFLSGEVLPGLLALQN